MFAKRTTRGGPSEIVGPWFHFALLSKVGSDWIKFASLVNTIISLLLARRSLAKVGIFRFLSIVEGLVTFFI
jgi:hypothetical protein